MIGKIKLEEIKCYGYHGCMEEEGILGTEYIVNIELELNLVNSILSDKLEDTVDYVKVNSIVKKEIDKRSKLIETVCGKIIKKINTEFENLISVLVEIKKTSPPINGNVKNVSIQLKSNKNNIIRF
ncbi:MAG: dihydroneopterin aldolase [Flavobacteriales bacterium TMED288]|nr:dihydroneopterin aldolase [Flavobacteriales bacterium]RPG53032.1 MAG: dihydroneopterin aldolase [Flavobacteriales bacterium TMED288]